MEAMDEQDSRQQVVRLTADRGVVPLWDTDEPEALSWEGLPLSARLQAELREWSDRFDTRLATRFRWEARGGQHGWEADGRRLATWLQSELGTGYRVEYDGP
jgi:hypothetical protein